VLQEFVERFLVVVACGRRDALGHRVDVRDNLAVGIDGAGVVPARPAIALDLRAGLLVEDLGFEAAELALTIRAGGGRDHDLDRAADSRGLDRLRDERVDRRAAVGVAVELLDEDQARLLALDRRAALLLDVAAGRTREDSDVLFVKPERQDPSAGVLLRLPPGAEDAVALARFEDEPAAASVVFRAWLISPPMTNTRGSATMYVEWCSASAPRMALLP
jgi:hypothetical protein